MTDLTPEQAIDAIDRRAYEMALAVLREPELRTELFVEAEQLAGRLVEVNDELERSNPAAHQQRSHQVSEATLDLLFVRLEIEMYSRRINRMRRPVE